MTVNSQCVAYASLVALNSAAVINQKEVIVESSHWGCVVNHTEFAFSAGVINHTEFAFSAGVFKQKEAMVESSHWICVGCKKYRVCIAYAQFATR